MQYNSNKFIEAYQKKNNNEIKCPFCGGRQFTSPDFFANILIGKDTNGIDIGSSVPSGMVICEKCGYIGFIALGALGLLSEEGETNGK